MTAGDRSFLKSMCEGMNDEVDNAPLPLGPDQNKDDVRFIGNALFWGLTKGAKNVDGARAFCAKMREFTKELKDEAAKTPGDEEAGLSAEQEEVCDYADSHSRLVYENGFGTWETERWEMWIEATLNNTPVATVLQTFKPCLLYTSFTLTSAISVVLDFILSPFLYFFRSISIIPYSPIKT